VTGCVVGVQERIIRQHLAQWLAVEKAVEMRPLVRALNLETSQTVFVGPYLTPPLRATFTHDYSLFNNAVMSFPVDLPGTNFYRGPRAVTRQARADALRRLPVLLATPGEEGRSRSRPGPLLLVGVCPAVPLSAVLNSNCSGGWTKPLARAVGRYGNQRQELRVSGVQCT
jgi:hypothetical protein